MVKEIINTINKGLSNGELSIDCAKELIKYLGVISGKEYTLLNKRVTYIEDGKFHDAWVNS